MERWGNSGDNSIYYYYDESGVCGMNYNGSEYYFRKNIFGDVLAIYDSAGSLQCRYVYDAWGNHRVYDENGAENTDSTFIGNINPFRYRSYYWDEEFNLYYLQTRYYDPEVGRFISPDDISYLDPESVVGLNLYAYCENNPVNNMDPTGHSVIAILALLGIGLIAGGVLSGVKAHNEGKEGWDFVKSIILGAAMGLAAAGAGVMLAGVVVGAASAFTSSMVTFLGVSAARTFAIGALAYDFTAFFIAPLYGIEMQGVDYETPKSPHNPPNINIPNRHPYNKIGVYYIL